jgi:hypothetical protein
MLTDFQKAKISHLQRAIWSLEAAKNEISVSIGNSGLGKSYIEDVDTLITQLQEDIDVTWGAEHEI